MSNNCVWKGTDVQQDSFSCPGAQGQCGRWVHKDLVLMVNSWGLVSGEVKGTRCKFKHTPHSQHHTRERNLSPGFWAWWELYVLFEETECTGLEFPTGSVYREILTFTLQEEPWKGAWLLCTLPSSALLPAWRAALFSCEWPILMVGGGLLVTLQNLAAG